MITTKEIVIFMTFCIGLCLSILFFGVIYHSNITKSENSKKDIMYKFYTSQLKSNDSITISECIKFVDNKCVIMAETIINNTDDLKILIYGK